MRVATAFLALAFALPAFGAFSFVRPITVVDAKVPSTQTGFPVLVSGTFNSAPDLRVVGSGGKVQNASGFDVGFYTSSTCTTKLAWETELYTAATGVAVYWVKPASVVSSGNVAFYLCYGDATITVDQSNKAGVWDANYKAIYHLSGSSLLTDSTGLLGSMTNVATATAVTGQIDGGLGVVKASSQYLDVASAVVTSYPFTVSGWFKEASGTGSGTVAGLADSADGSNRKILLVNAGKMGLYAQDATTGSVFIATTTSYTAATWQYGVAVFASSTDFRVYLNGGNKITGSTAVTFGTPERTRIGLDSTAVGSQNYLNGSIDEVRFSNIARADDWITTEYNNQSSPSTFYTIGSESTPTGGSPAHRTMRPVIIIGALYSLGFVNYFPMTAGSGSVLTDTIAGNNGTFGSGTASPLWTLGGGVDCNGSNEYVSIPATHMTGDFTIAFSFQTPVQDGPGAGAVLIGAYNPVTPFQGWGVGVNMAGVSNRMQYYSSGDSTWRAGTATITDHLVHSYVISRTGTTISFYLDGVADGTATSAAPADWSGITSLCSTGGVNSWYAGQIFNFGLANRAWTTADIAYYTASVSSYMTSLAVFPTVPDVPLPATFVTVPSNGLALKPLMGWFNYYWLPSPSKSQFEGACATMASNGMVAAGYVTCQLTDSRTTAFDAAGFPITHSFPHSGTTPGMQVEANYVHSLGEKFGWYTSPGKVECGGYYGVFGHEARAAARAATMGVDTIFFDWCLDDSRDSGYKDLNVTYGAGYIDRAVNQFFAQKIQATGRDIILEAGPVVYPGYDGSLVSAFGRAEGINSWRYHADAPCCWSSINWIFTPTSVGPFAGPSGWNYPDVLQIGNGLTDDEGRSQISIYAITASPLISSTNLSSLSSPNLATLINSDVIAVDQDALGIAGSQATTTSCGDGSCAVWVRQITGTNTWAVALFNLSSTSQSVAATWSAIHSAIPAFANMSYTTTRDLWAHASLGTLATGYTATVASHGVAMLTVSP